MANTRKDDSDIQIKNKQDLLFVLTDRNIFVKVLKQANNTLKVPNTLRNNS
ncbi:MAG: hypothetical protein WBL67_19835 [Nitrososphaeraceae archaeon]